MPGRVYVQIPAYRDRELVPTVADLLRAASHPDRLRVAIAWQHDAREAPLERALRRLGPVELTTIPAARSQGCNWARHLLQQRWNGEPYTLFLDSHHRFVDGWDEQVIDLFEALRGGGVRKPILTGYLPPYDPANDPGGRVEAIYRMDVAERQRQMVFRLTGHAIRGWRRLASPVPARFASLHFLFAAGPFNEEVPFDPAVYFFADEVAIALRAYSRGYDLFHPHKMLGWHLYDRATRVTHWDDHPSWRVQNERSFERLRALFSGSLGGPYGLGTARTVADYETFAGLRLMGSGSRTCAS